MDRSIPSVIPEGSIPDFSQSSHENGHHIERNSLDSLNSSWRNDQDDSISLSLNDDLLSRNGSVAMSRRSFESSSIFTSSFRQSIDDSLPLLGLNKLSIQKVSPLGPNSIYELIADVDARKSKSSSLSPNVNSRSKVSKINILPPTSSEIPPIQLSKIEKAPKETFKNYLNDIGKEYQKYSSNKQLTSNTLNDLINKQDGDDNLLASEANDLESIPEIFFNEDFNLDDPRVFKTVTEGHSVDNLNDILQDKLSGYLDTIEIHLVNEISKSSSSFFDALNDLNNISDKNVTTVGLINDLKKKIQVLEEKKIEQNLTKLKLKQKRTNVARLEQGLLQVNTVVQQSRRAETLFLQGDYEECLDQIDEVENLAHGESLSIKWPFPLQDISEVPALTIVRDKLVTLRSQTGQSYSKIFVDFLLNDLREHYEEIDYEKTLNRLMSGSNYQREISDAFRDKLKEYVIGLARTDEIANAFRLYEEHFINDMKNIVRIFLPNEESVSAASAKGSSSVASSTVNKVSGKSLSTLIKSLTPREFEDMLLKIYSTISEGLRRLTVHQKLLLDLALGNIEDIQGDLIMKLDIRGTINRTIEIIQTRVGKINNVRREINAKLRYDYFLRIFYINSIFLNECESISGLTFKYLPDIISSHVKAFNSMTHQENLKTIQHSISIEEWKPLIVPSALQLIVNDIVDNKDLDADHHWKDELLHLRKEGNDPASTEEPQETSHKRSIVIGDKTFVANNSLLVLINLIKDTLILKSNFHYLSTIYEANVLELLQFYNTKVMQSVKKPDGSLDREKNLSVVGESLDCLQELIHYIRICFDNLDHDDIYNRLLQDLLSSKNMIDSINTTMLE